MFRADCNGKDYRDELAVHFPIEADRKCWTCEKAVHRGSLCGECGAVVEEGGEA